MQKLVDWLRSGRRLTCRLFAEEYEVSRRTVQRDIDYLRMIGAPIEFDRRRETFFLSEPWEDLPDLRLTAGQFAALLVATHALEALHDTPHARLLSGIVAHLSDELPDTVHVEPSFFTRNIQFERSSSLRSHLTQLPLLNEAIRKRRVLRMRYRSNKTREVTDRDVEPRGLVNHEGRWYLIGWCRLRRAMRDFRAERIQHAEMTNEMIPDADFDLEAYLSESFGMHRGEPPQAVHLRFTPYQARWIREERRHATEILAERADGTLDLRMQVSGLQDVARWVLSYGAEVEVLAPKALRHRIAAEARMMVALYD